MITVPMWLLFLDALIFFAAGTKVSDYSWRSRAKTPFRKESGGKLYRVTEEP